MEFTPEERQRIFEEEKIRVEARTHIEKAQKEQLIQAGHSKFSAKKMSLWAGLSLALLAVVVWVVWKVRLAGANEELIAALHQAETSVGSSPSDDSWKYTEGQAFFARERDHNHRLAALLNIQALQYAVNDDRVASSYNSLGLELEKLHLIEAAEHCHRLAASLAPHDDFTQKCLADLLMDEKKYAEAESIYRALLPRAADANAKFTLNFRLAGLLEATGRKTEADSYKKEYQKWIGQMK